MILKDFLSNALQVNEAYRASMRVIDYLFFIGSFKDKYIEMLKEFLNSYDRTSAQITFKKLSPIFDQISNLNKSILNEIRRYKPADLIDQIRILNDGLKMAKISFEDNITVNDTRKLINLHTNAYSEKGFDDILSFISYCKYYTKKIHQIFFTSSTFLNNLELESKSIPKDNQVIEIQIISQEYSLRNFASLLSYIDDLYQDLCKAFPIHYEDFPLNVIKVESGSIWAKLFGKFDLIQLIKDLIVGLANYIRDLQTGKIDLEKFENKVKKAELVIELKAKAKECGMDKKNEVLLEKIFENAILNFAKRIPKTTTEIFLDDEPILKLNETETKAIEGKRSLMLKSKNESKDNKS